MPDTYIVINRHVVAANTKKGSDYEPPIRVTRGKNGKPKYAFHVLVHGPTELMYDPVNPVMPCGAKVALKTSAEVEIVA